MKSKVTWSVSIVAVSLATLLILYLRPPREALVSDFKWSVDGQTAPFSFVTMDHTKREIEVVVLIVAQDASEGRDGVHLKTVGHQVLNIRVRPNKSHRQSGVLQLTHMATSATIISISADLRSQQE